MKGKIRCVAEWIGTNLLLPLIPIAVRVIVRVFSSDEIPLWDPNDLLYYNFFICLLLLSGLREYNGILASCARNVLWLLCIVDNILIVLVLQGSANAYVLQFSIVAAVTCAGFGIVFALVDGFFGNGGGKSA